MELVELWYAQYWVPNPPELCPCEVAITYCTLALPKCCAARTASAAICDWRGFEGAVLALSAQTPAKMPDGLPAGLLEPPQLTVPLGTPWQYWITLFDQGLLP